MKGDIKTRCVYKVAVSCTSGQQEQLSTQKGITVIVTKIELDSHADTCVKGVQYSVMHDHNIPVNVYGNDHEVGSKHADRVDATVANDKPEIPGRFPLNPPGD